MKQVGARYYDLIKGPFRAPKVLLIACAAIALLAVMLSIIWPHFRPVAESVLAIYVVFTILLGLLLLTRLFGKVHDIQASVSLYANLSLTSCFREGLFVDGAAANAALLLFIYKCLLFCKPQRILELGSGQTTKLFAQYYHQNPGIYVCTLEHNESWVRKLMAMITNNGKCHDYRHSPLTDRRFVCRGTQKLIHTQWYAPPIELRQKRFDLILVDGPDTGPETSYTREGILEYVPEILGNSFVVIFDDAERADEIRLVKSFHEILKAHKIASVRFDIQAVKTQTVFCSPDFAFLRSV